MGTVANCPICGCPIFADAVCWIGEPINESYAVYLTHVVLDHRGSITSFEFEYGSLTRAIDFDDCVFRRCGHRVPVMRPARLVV